MMPYFSLRVTCLLLALASALVLAGALFGQFVLHWYPCDLCLYQRWPHLVVVILGLVGALPHIAPTTRKYLLIGCILGLTTSLAIAGYHTGVEWNLFDGPSACSATNDGTPKTIEQLRAEILGAALVSCKQAMAYVLGLSLAVWNCIISLGLATCGLAMLRRHHISNDK